MNDVHTGIRSSVGNDPFERAALNPYAYQDDGYCPTGICAQTGACVESSSIEVGCSSLQSLITSGGGFSNNFGRPAWQEPYVQRYFQSTIPPETRLFNQTGRGYPDVAIVGTNYGLYFSGFFLPTDGTSASTPVMAGIIALLVGKYGKLGDVKQLFYHLSITSANVFRDVTEGNNGCTSSAGNALGYVGCVNGIVTPQDNYWVGYHPGGFNATAGWDPVTGLGTPNVKELDKAIGRLLQQ